MDRPQKTTLVTGAAGGMGHAITVRLQQSGWKVVGLDRVAAPHCDAHYVVDVTNSQEMLLAVEGAQAAIGHMGALISAAGHYESLPFVEVSDEAASDMLRVHLGGFIAGVRAVVPSMKARGGGSIIAISSELAVGGGAGESHYAAAKGAVIGAVRSLAAELAPSHIRVNAIAPGPTDTHMLTPDSAWREPGYVSALPTGALVTAEEVASCVAFLADSAGFVTGETLHPNAGAVI